MFHQRGRASNLSGRELTVRELSGRQLPKPGLQAACLARAQRNFGRTGQLHRSLIKGERGLPSRRLPKSDIGADMDQEKQEQLRAHIDALEAVAASVDLAVDARPPGADRDNMAALGARLRSSAGRLKAELETLARPRSGRPADSRAADMD